MQEAVKAETIKLLDEGIIYHISDSAWMLERLAGHEFYCFLDGYSGYNQITIALEDQEKTTFTCPYDTFSLQQPELGVEEVRGDEPGAELGEVSLHGTRGIVLGHKISDQGIEVDLTTPRV
ncbi:uncharacterized protein [Primulina huaijiensis]|uniref:uncharacterized protein n=1 Tax=Primulina huaijiensis TaxID=1492673 RepID=UPI003CC70990